MIQAWMAAKRPPRPPPAPAPGRAPRRRPAPQRRGRPPPGRAQGPASRQSDGAPWSSSCRSRFPAHRGSWNRRGRRQRRRRAWLGRAAPPLVRGPRRGLELPQRVLHIGPTQPFNLETCDVSETVERHEFGAEVGRLLDLVVHALYSDREIFLRELVANAADAIDRRRFEALTQARHRRRRPMPRSASLPDKAARTLTIDRCRHRHGQGGAGEEPRHHRPLRHPRLHPVAGRGQAGRAAEPDRPVRRRLLLRLHGRRPGRGDVAPRRRRGGLDLGLGRAGGLHPGRPPTREEPGTDHRAAHEGRCRGIPRAAAAADHHPQMGRPHHRPHHHRRGRQGRRRRTRAPRSGASRSPRSPRSSTPTSTATSAISSTSPGPRCTGAPRAPPNSPPCSSSPA